MKRLSTYFFLIIIFGMGIASSISYLFRVDSYKLNNTVIKDTIWTVNDGSSIKINEEQSSIIKSYIQYMEEAIDVNLFLKQSFIEYYGIIQRLLHRNIVEDASKENDVYLQFSRRNFQEGIDATFPNGANEAIPGSLPCTPRQHLSQITISVLPFKPPHSVPTRWE